MRIIKAAPTEWEIECLCGAVLGYTEDDFLDDKPRIACANCNKVVCVASEVRFRTAARNKPPTVPEAISRTKNWDQ